MRRVNTITTAALMLLFLIHMICGSLIAAGMMKGGSALFHALTGVFILLVGVHGLIAIGLTIRTIRAARRSGVFYVRENLLFLTRRISGFALLFFMLAHIVAFTGVEENGAYRLRPFGRVELLSQLMMLFTLALHLVTNINPLRISLGLSDRRGVRVDIALVLSVLLLLSGIAFAVYYMRWLAR